MSKKGYTASQSDMLCRPKLSSDTKFHKNKFMLIGKTYFKYLIFMDEGICSSVTYITPGLLVHSDPLLPKTITVKSAIAFLLVFL